MNIDSFCRTIWNRPYKTIQNDIKNKDYHTFYIPKKNGMRAISSLPETSILYIRQKELCENFLYKQPLPICVKGFIKNENYCSYLEPHIGSKYFLRLDIKNFFPTITDELIKNTFSSIISFDTDKDEKKIIDLIIDICCYNGNLPQGAPSSPIISNLVFSHLDQRITKYCQIFDIIYTRYADDMLFSNINFDFKLKKWFVRKIKFILSSNKFQINYNKIKYGNEEISLNGYVISQNGIRLSRKRFCDIQTIISFTKKNNGNTNTFLKNINQLPLKYRDLNKYPFKSKFQFIQYIIGYRSYFISFLNHNIEQKFRKKILKTIRQLENIIIKFS